jgi:hypothetical protein
MGVYKKFHEWISRKLEPGVRLWLVIGFCLVCAVLYVTGKALGNFKGTAGEWCLAALGELGGVGVAAVISGVILKVLAMQGYFLSALAEIVLSDQALDHLEPSRRQYLWQRLTQRIYMPGLWNQLQSGTVDHDLGKLRDKLSDAVSKRFSYEKTAYIRSMKMKFTIEWADPTKKDQIVKKERLRFTQVPFVPAEPTEWEVVRTAEAHLGLDAYRRELKALTINERPPPVPEVKVSADAPLRETLVYVLKGSPEYVIVEEEHVTWTLAKDPSWTRNLSKVAETVEIEIENKADGLMIVVLEVGGDNQYKIEEGARGVLRFGDHSVMVSRGVVLPDQGIQMIFIRDGGQPLQPQTNPSHEIVTEEAAIS